MTIEPTREPGGKRLVVDLRLRLGSEASATRGA
jgi:hypothetical protein